MKFHQFFIYFSYSQVIANGCIFGDGAYFKDGWNVLDGILVIISLVNVGFEIFVTGGGAIQF